MTETDAIVIGGGIEGITAACALARAGRRVLLVEEAGEPGGLMRPLALEGGLEASMAPLSGLALSPRVLQETGLTRHGLVLAPHGGVAAVAPGRAPVALSTDRQATEEGLEELAPGEALRLARFATEMSRVRSLIEPLGARVPADPAGLRARDLPDDLSEMLSLAGRFGEETVFDLLNLCAASAADRLNADFASEPLRVLLAAQALARQGAGPMTPGTGLALSGLPGLDASAGFGATPLGGARALAKALVMAATAAGVSVRFETKAHAVRVEDGAVTGLVLSTGEEVRAPLILSSLDMKRTLTELLEWQALPQDLSRAVSRADAEGSVARLFLTVGTLDFLPPALRALRPAAVHVAASLEAMEWAGDEAAFARIPVAPWLEVEMPSLCDPLTDGYGPHVLSISVHYVPWRPADGGWTDARRRQLLERVLASLAGVWPELLATVSASQLWLPHEIEAEYGGTGGLLGGGEIAPDRLFWNRPLPDLARYATPVHGLYLCGADTHTLPGAGGLAGVNAAHAALAAPAHAPARGFSLLRWIGGWS